ncbi:MAG: Flp pilus assembly complex ATPase component TadA [Planctomycetes bacterium]|nr:Flp pilus assembly complex ATPase component TadA [Planctomycetota bacterium]
MLLKRSQKLGDMLVEQGVISEDDLQRALDSQKTGHKRLGETLVAMKVVNANTLVNAIARQVGVNGCTIRHGLVDPKAVQLIEREDAKRFKVLPLFLVENTLTVAMAEPQSLPAIDHLAQTAGHQINPVLALESNIAEYQDKYMGPQVNVESFLTSLTESDVEVVERETDEEASAEIDRMIDGSPIVNLVNLAFLTAIRHNASDIHVEPDRHSTRIRYRIDGILQELMTPPAGMHAAVVSRIKVIGKMDISEKRLPQEGRVHVVAEGRDIDLRVSTMPTILGEKVVIRILDRSKLNVSLEQLGLDGPELDEFQTMLRKPHGLALVTGPTGSGKTTTLYCAIDQIKDFGRNVLTVEDPVEYQLDLVNQIQINDGIGLTFPRALRSILRQDPDVILVGEIRDAETARVAVQAALTGHIVLSTLHTNTSPGAVVRMIDMGIEPYLLASALNGAVAQRLVRRNCPACIASYYPSEAALRDADRVDDVRRVYKKGEGCSKCHQTGFSGRVAVYEVMAVDEGLRHLIHDEVGEEELKDHLRQRNWRDLRANGLRLAERGMATLEEVLRVTHVETDTRVRAERGGTAPPDGTPRAAPNQSRAPQPNPQAQAAGTPGRAEA